jgi:arginase
MGARRVEILGVPFNSAGTTDGVARAPAALRAVGLGEAMRASGMDVVDRGDVALGPTEPVRDPVSGLIAPDALAAMVRQVRAAVGSILEAGAFPLVLGGDCPVLIGCLGAGEASSGDGGSPPGLLFIDGHEDAWPPRTSTTGEAADMELGLLLHRNLDRLPEELVAGIPAVDPARVIVLGARDKREVADAGVASVEDVVEVIGPETLEAVDALAFGFETASRLASLGPWWLHVDLDVLSTESLAAVDYPQPGGIGWDVLTGLTRGGLMDPGVRGFDVTIYNPDLDPDSAGARAIVRYLVDALRN